MAQLIVWIAEDVNINAIGQGSLIVDGNPISSNIGQFTVTPGDSVTVQAVPANDYDFVHWDVSGVVVSTVNPYTFTMPAGTLILRAVTTYNPNNVINVPIPSNDYAVRFEYEYTNRWGNETLIQIEQRGFVGTKQLREIQRVRYEFGNANSDPIEVIVPSRLTLDLIADFAEDYRLFLDCDIREFRVKYFKKGLQK